MRRRQARRSGADRCRCDSFGGEDTDRTLMCEQCGTGRSNLPRAMTCTAAPCAIGLQRMPLPFPPAPAAFGLIDWFVLGGYVALMLVIGFVAAGEERRPKTQAPGIFLRRRPLPAL